MIAGGNSCRLGQQIISSSRATSACMRNMRHGLAIACMPSTVRRHDREAMCDDLPACVGNQHIHVCAEHRPIACIAVARCPFHEPLAGAPAGAHPWRCNGPFDRRRRPGPGACPGADAHMARAHAASHMPPWNSTICQTVSHPLSLPEHTTPAMPPPPNPCMAAETCIHAHWCSTHTCWPQVHP